MPGRLALQALKQATSPSAINTLSSAIAQGAIAVSRNEQELQIEGLEVEVEFDQSRLLTTAGVSSAIALGTVYWLGSRLQMQTRYAQFILALEALEVALGEGSSQTVERALKRIDDVANPLLDPTTLQPIDDAKEVQAVFEQVMKRPASSGVMFNASTFTTSIDDALKVGTRAGSLLALEAVEEGLDAMRTKALPQAGSTIARIAGKALWVDTVYWLATSAIDVGLNFFGVPENRQRIPFLADIPLIGGLFDFSDSLGASAVDLVLTPLLEAVFSFFGLEDEAQALTDALWGIIISAGLSPTLAPFVLAILEFYIEEVNISFDLELLFGISAKNVDFSIDIWRLVAFEPIDILVLWLYAIVAKILVKAWIVPSFQAFKQ